MQRIGQPAVMGQLLGGLLLGPSVFGLIWPDLQHALFPQTAAQNSMLDAVSQLGILMLLLLTGMETDLRLVRRVGRAAITVAAAGVVLPFICGFALGEMLPDAILPSPQARLVTALFLATALSISSIKIVAMVVREMNFMRRDIGQIIVASAILEGFGRMDHHRRRVRFGVIRHHRFSLGQLRHPRHVAVPGGEFHHWAASRIRLDPLDQ
jgi:Kef-type K+ transport system membrane component KefB